MATPTGERRHEQRSTHELAALTSFNRILAAGGSFRDACARALAHAAGPLGWHAASVHLVIGDDVVAEAANAGAPIDAYARLVRVQRARVARAPTFGVQTDGRIRRDAVAVPLESGGAVVGVLDVIWASPGPATPSLAFPFIDALASTLAVWVERAQLTAELEQRLAETMTVRRQLEAYARDVRETFQAEKQRAEQLAGALDELERTYLATVRSLAVAVEAKDETTGGHLIRVARIGRALVASLAPDRADDPQLGYGFLLHDIGKLTVPDAILAKDGPLTAEEWAIMHRHPAEGARILADIPFLREAREIVYAHHEQWDGRGYPLGLQGEEIPFGARVFPVADAFDAMTSPRPYRAAMTIERALSELRRSSGTQFWADAVEAIEAVPREELFQMQGAASGAAARPDARATFSPPAHASVREGSA